MLTYDASQYDVVAFAVLDSIFYCISVLFCVILNIKVTRCREVFVIEQGMFVWGCCQRL